MTIDYVYLKRILNKMRDMQSFMVDMDILADTMCSTTDDTERFYGHMLLLCDCGAIEQLTGHNLGITYGPDGIAQRNNCTVRLTAHGYEIAELLNKNGALEKLKRLSISTVGEIAKALVQQVATKITI